MTGEAAKRKLREQGKTIKQWAERTATRMFWSRVSFGEYRKPTTEKGTKLPSRSE